MSQVHILDGQEDTILDFITMDNLIEDNHKKSIEDTLETYDFIAFGDKRYSEFLEKRNRVIIPDEDGTLREFVIFENARYLDTEGRKIQVFGHASYLELKKANVVYPDSFKGTATQHGGRALKDTGWQIGLVEVDGDITITINEHTVPYDYLKRIAKEFDGELSFRIKHDGRRITGRYVDILDRIGDWQGREVEFGKDLDSIRRVEKQDIVTALLGLGPERDDGPRIEVLIEDFDALQRWGRIDEHGKLQHLIEPYEIQSERSEMTQTEAHRYTRTALNKRINTQITYETTILDLEEVVGHENKKIRFGDTIKIKDTKFNPPLYLEARVFEMTRSIKRKDKKDIKLGDFIEHTEEEVNAIWKELQKQMQKRVSHYEMAEYTYDKLTIDDKDETVFEEGKTFTEATGIKAEENAKDFAAEEDKKIKVDVQDYADNVSEQKAQSALDSAKQYAVAKEVYDIQMEQIASDIEDRAPIEYVDGELKHAIEKLEYENRNLLLGTSSVFSTYDRKHTWGDFEPYDEVELTEGETYTASVYLDVEQSPKEVFLMVRVSGSTYIDFRGNKFKEGEKGYSSVTFEMPHGWDKVRVMVVRFDDKLTSHDIVHYKEAKLERGSYRTPHTLAPEDMFSEIEKKADGNTVYTIEDVDNMINNTVSITQYETDKEDIVTDLKSQGTRIGQNEKAIGLKADSSELDTVENSLNTKIGNVEVKADEVKTSVSEVRANLDGLEVGGTNLNKDSNNFNPNVMTTYDGSSVTQYEDNYKVEEWGATDAHKMRFTGGDQNSILKGIKNITSDTPTVEGKTYTVSLYVKNLRDVPMSVRVNGLENTPIVELEANEAKRVVVTEKRSTSFLQLQFRAASTGRYVDVALWRAQVEEGNKVTPWSPAPEDTDEAINEVSGRVTSAEGEIKTLAGEVSLKASKSVVDSLENRVSTAEGDLKVLPGEINAKVSKDGAFGELNLSPDKALLDFERVNITGKLEAKHIKSLAGLNVNDQFVVDTSGKVTIGNNRVTIDDKSISITRPDGAIWMQDGLVKDAPTVLGIEPMYMDREIWEGESPPLVQPAFTEHTGYFHKKVGLLDGREGKYKDNRDSDYRSSLRVQRYYFIHSARYLVLTYRSRTISSEYLGENLHRHLALIYDDKDNKLVDHGVPENTIETVELIADLGKPTYKNRWVDFRIGWAAGWGNKDDYIRFRINNVVQTDYII